VRLKQAHSVRVLELRLERFQVSLVSEGHFSQLQINCKLRASALNGFGVSLPLTLKAISALRHHPCPQHTADKNQELYPQNNKPVPRAHLSDKTRINQSARQDGLRIDGFSYPLSVSTLANPTSAAAGLDVLLGAGDDSPNPTGRRKSQLTPKVAAKQLDSFSGARHAVANLGYPGQPIFSFPEQPGSASPCVSMNTVIHTLNGQSLASQNTAAAGTGASGASACPLRLLLGDMPVGRCGGHLSTRNTRRAHSLVKQSRCQTCRMG
jgi:hypothetical protein